MKKRVFTVCLAALVVALAMMIPSFASSRAVISKNHQTSESRKDGSASIRLECGTTQADTFLCGVTTSIGDIGRYLKDVEGELYKTPSRVYKSNFSSTVSSKSVGVNVAFDWYNDGPYLTYAQTRHTVSKISDPSDNWEGIITLAYNDRFGIWVETNEHINP